MYAIKNEMEQATQQPINVESDKAANPAQSLWRDIKNWIAPPVSAQSCSGVIECGTYVDDCRYSNNTNQDCSSSFDCGGAACVCGPQCVAGSPATHSESCPDFTTQSTCTASHNSACSGQCAFKDSCSWYSGVGPTPTPGGVGGGACADSCSGTVNGTKCACGNHPNCDNSGAAGCEGTGGNDGKICTPDDPTKVVAGVHQPQRRH